MGGKSAQHNLEIIDIIQTTTAGAAMYAKLPGGRLDPGGLIVPCEVITLMTHGAVVKFTSEDGKTSWTSYVRNERLLQDSEVE